MEIDLKTKIFSILIMAGLLTVGTTASVFADGQIRYNYIPNTISPEAQKTLTELYAVKLYERVLPDPDDLDGWKKTYDAAEKAKEPTIAKIIADNKVTITKVIMGGTPVLDIRPEGWRDNGKVVVYTHGGAYVLFSARSTLVSSAPMAHLTGLRVISVDYTTAPFAKWNNIQEQVVSAHL